MIKTIHLTLLMFLSFSAFSQRANRLFQEVDSKTKSDIPLDLKDHYSILAVNEDYWEEILASHPAQIELSIPFRGELLKVSLNKVNVMESFTIRTSSGNDLDFNEVSRSVFYRGTFDDYSYSHFTLSILNNEIIGVGSIPGKGDLNLGKLENRDEYIFLSELAMKSGNPLECSTEDDYELEMWEEGHTPHPETISPKSLGDCVGVYFEVDHDIFLGKGGVVEAADYVTALFNEIQFLYSEDGITVYISDMFVWDEVSPYAGITNMSTLLDLFGTETTVWTGDIGQFVSYRGGGGLAWVDVLCFPNQYYRKAASDINSTFAEVPLYSWSVEVVTHEMGHNLGSPHTHACFWNGTGTAIDGCGPEAGYSEGCDAPLPVSGTIMSYCHLVGGVGIDLALGFGDQPAEHMRDRIIAADCLDGCDLLFIDAELSSATIDPLFCVGASTTPEIVVANNCEEDLISIEIEVFIDDVLEESVAWTGSILPDDSETIILPEMTPELGIHTLRIELSSPNGEEDDVVENNEFEVEIEARAYPEVSIASFENISCFGANDGTIDVEVSGGTPDYTYLWDLGAGTMEDASGLAENTYTLIVTDDLGCQTEISQEITQPTALVSSVMILSSPACFGDLTGSVETTVSGGTPGYTYAWSSGGTESTESMLGSGDYVVTITDLNGCTNEELITIEEPLELVSSITVLSSPACFGDLTGSVEATVSGGTPGYTYIWSSGGTTSTELMLGSGDYMVTVTDMNGCVSEESIAIEEPDDLDATAITSDEIFGEDGEIDVTVTGGIPDYVYAWDNDETTEDISDLSAGTYVLTVTDANGCSKEFEFTVNGQSGIDEDSDNPFIIYPNPASTTISISNPEGILIETVQLYNSLGQIIVKEIMPAINSDFTIDITPFDSGVYYFVLDTGEERYKTKLLIKN